MPITFAPSKIKPKSEILNSVKFKNYKEMKLSSFGFNLPKESIAMYPAKNRDESKLMVIDRKTKKIEHKKFHESLKYFNDGDVLLLNNTKVFPARLYGTRKKPVQKLKYSYCAN